MGEPDLIHTWRTGEYRYIACRFVPELYEEMSRLVPGDRLDYDPVRNVWRIRGIYWLTLRRVLVEDFRLGQIKEYPSRSEFEARNPAASRAHPVVHASEAYETLFLLPGAPESVGEAAFRALAKIYHPDLGGDPKRMSALNTARQSILSKKVA